MNIVLALYQSLQRKLHISEVDQNFINLADAISSVSDTADAASQTADSASQTADSASQTADSASQTAASAQTTANSALTAANSAAQVENGTWTPTLRGATTAGDTTYTTQSGTYTKVGDQVTVNMALHTATKTGTGNAILGGLPFTPKAGACSSGILAFSNITAAGKTLAVYTANGSAMNFNLTDQAGGGWSLLQMSAVADNSYFYGSFTYKI